MQPNSPSCLETVKIQLLASAQAACLLAPLMAELGNRGVQFRFLGNDRWELSTCLEQKGFKPARLGRLKHMATSISNYLGDVWLSWEKQQLSKWPPRAHKRFFGLFQVTPRLWVGPPGTTVEMGPNQSLLELETGQAKHCGLEPQCSTALSLLEELLSKERIRNALDIKAGTALFSMAAALWGAERVLALDQEPHAVRIARKNIKRNLLGARIKVRCAPVWSSGGAYDLVMAVASPKILSRQMPHILRRLRQDGWLLLGGLRYREVDEFLSSWCAALSLESRKRQLWWESLLLRRRGQIP